MGERRSPNSLPRPHAAYRDSPSMSNARGEHSAADVVAKAQAVLSEAELLRTLPRYREESRCGHR